MPRTNFFANISPNASNENNKGPASIDTNANSNTSLDTKQKYEKPKRIAYTIKIDPSVRQSIKNWATDHNVTISSVIESLARKYLPSLTDNDIQK